MQFRFRTFDEKSNNYKLVAYAKVESYDVMFRTLNYMAEHKCEYALEINTESSVETVGMNYEVIGVALCVDKNYGEESLTPHFVVDLEER